MDFSIVDSDTNNISGCDENKLDAMLKATIPRVESLGTYNPFASFDCSFTFMEIQNDESQPSDQERTYDILDLVEFIYQHLHDCKKVHYHEHLNYFHFVYVEGDEMKKGFRESINDFFRRNGMVYELSAEGEIQRLTPIALAGLFQVKHNTKDEELNNMLDLAVDKFLSPKIEDRRIGLEKLWDAFERLKTIDGSTNKSKSADAVVAKMGNNSKEIIEILTNEMISLTNIGNNFMIRHSETYKTKIEAPAHIDYLFYRMMALVNLFLDKYSQ